MNSSETLHRYREGTKYVLSDAPLPAGLEQAYLRLVESRPTNESAWMISANGITGNSNWTVPLLATGFALPPAIVTDSARCGLDVVDRLSKGSVRTHTDVPVLHIPPAEGERLVFSLPIFFQAGILATDFCNLSCSMCMFHSQLTGTPNTFKDKRRVDRKRLQLSPVQIRLFLDQLPPGLPVLFSASGEFLTLTDPMDTILYAGQKGLRPRLNTNGILLSAEYSKQFVESGADHIIVSVDGYDAASYARHRIGGDLNMVLGNIAVLRAIAKAADSSLSINVNTILFEECIPKKNDIHLFWEDKVDRLSFLAERNDYLGRVDVPMVVPPLFTECFEMLNGPILLTNSLVAPCCSIAIAEWFEDFPWLESIEHASLEDILSRYRTLFLDKTSHFSHFCTRCHYKKNSYTYKGISPYSKSFDFFSAVPAPQKLCLPSFFTRLTRLFS